MKLKCVVVTVNDEETFRRNIVENKQRAETTPIDDAFNQRRLREEFDWADARIAEFYGMASSYVGLLKKLLMLPTDAQLHVHKRELSVQAAAALADLPAGEQKQALAGRQPGESLSMSVVKQVREQKIARGGKQSRSLAEVRSFLEGLTGPAERPQVKDLCDLLLEYIQGRLADDTMAQRLSALFPERKQEEQGAA